MKELKRHLSLLLAAHNLEALRQELAALDPVRAAKIIRETREAERIILFRNLPAASAETAFRDLDPQEQERFIDEIVAQLRAEARRPEPPSDCEYPDPAAELPGCVVRRLLERTPAEAREALFRFLGYPPDAIARSMTPGFVALRPGSTAEEALARIRKYGAAAESIDVLYVVDENWRPIRTVGIRELLLADPKQHVAEFGKAGFQTIRALDDREHVAAAFQEGGPALLPVTDSAGSLLGIVALDEIREIERTEATEDFQKFGGSEELELSYTRTPLPGLVKKRAGWLVILFLSEMLTALAMGYFDDEIARAVVLALFVPLVISSGGNSGSQAASLIIRALALGEISIRNGWYVLRKELLSGLLLGTILGTIGFIRILVWQLCGIYDYGVFWIWIAVSVAVSLLFIVLWGTFAGAMIPLLLKRLGLDPATASAPFVATLADVTGLIIYFSVAALFLSGKLL